MNIYTVIRFFKDLPRNTKYFLQKVFRSTHTSDFEVWCLFSPMAKWILPRLYQFKKSKRMGYPGIFSEYYENEWKSKEEYDESVASGKTLSGGPEAWEKVLDEIIFAFEFTLADEGIKKYEKPFMKKYGDWNEEIPENLQQHNWYRHKTDGSCMLPGTAPTDTPPDLSEYEPDPDNIMGGEFYYNMEMHQEFAERAYEGFKLFGRFFQSFWD